LSFIYFCFVLSLMLKWWLRVVHCKKKLSVLMAGYIKEFLLCHQLRQSLVVTFFFAKKDVFPFFNDFTVYRLGLDILKFFFIIKKRFAAASSVFTGCSLNIVFFPRISNWSVPVHSHCVESFEGLFDVGEGWVAVNFEKTQFFLNTM